MEKVDVGFETISFLVEELNRKINIEYDYIVGVGRGGFIPATLLAYKQDKKILAFGISTYDDNLSNSDIGNIYQPLNIPEDCKRVLVVDDICDTGNTFDIIRTLYSDKVQLFFSSLYVKQATEDKVNFYSTIVEDEVWLNFPWEYI